MGRIYEKERNEYHTNIMNKYGLVRTIEFGTNDYEEVKTKEMEYIEKYKTYHYENTEKHAANFTRGSEDILGYRHKDDAKKKMSENNIGEKNPFYGKTHSEEIKQNRRDGWTGNGNPMAKEKKKKNKEILTERMKSELNPMKKKENKEALSKRISGRNNPSAKFSEETIDKVIELRKLGKTYEAIKIETGISVSRIGVIINESMSEENKELRTNYRLEQKDYDLIVSLKNKGFNFVEISKQTGISHTQVQRMYKKEINNGK